MNCYFYDPNDMMVNVRSAYENGIVNRNKSDFFRIRNVFMIKTKMKAMKQKTGKISMSY
jgi:hypothetical protein